MKSTAVSVLPLLAGFAVLGLVPATLAHGDDMDMDMITGEGEAAAPVEYPPNYFTHPEHQGVIWAHIAIMTISWVFVLPVAVMFSIARSRYTLLTQFVFITTNLVGVLLSTIYNASTPDLYPNNAHHKIGWIATWAVCAQVVVGLLGWVSGAMKRESSRPATSERQGFIAVSQEAMEQHDSRYPKHYRMSNDSGQGTEPNTESLRSHSLSSSSGAASPPIPLRDIQKEYGENDDDDDDLEAHLPAITRSGAARNFVNKISGLISSRVWNVLIFCYNFVDRTILLLGFITLCTGLITFGRFFEGQYIFTGLAHWIKGGVFFWLGVLTLGRWCGSFGEVGWAWNVRPKKIGQKWRPSAEFAESFLIFFYGSTNIFLEHLGNDARGVSKFSPQDLEHVSITVLFIGGGACGMLVESLWVRDLLNTTVVEAAQGNEHAHHDEEHALQEPESYRFSINPIPALVILLLGISMSSHTQASVLSSMVHKQWGNLLTGASFARAFTYVLLYLKPPKSVYPSRPPTELLTAFGLMAGGIIFMASSGDTVTGMAHYDMDAMMFYVVTMGLVGLLMAWVITVLALKGWAVRKEAKRPIILFRNA